MASTLACMRSRGNKLPYKNNLTQTSLQHDVERAQPAMERPLGALENAPAASRWWLLRGDANGGGGGMERAVARGERCGGWRGRWRHGERGCGVEIEGGGAWRVLWRCGEGGGGVESIVAAWRSRAAARGERCGGVESLVAALRGRWWRGEYGGGVEIEDGGGVERSTAGRAARSFVSTS